MCCFCCCSFVLRIGGFIVDDVVSMQWVLRELQNLNLVCIVNSMKIHDTNNNNGVIDDHIDENQTADWAR